MRIATFNLESLDLPPKAHVPLEVRAEVLRPALTRLEADVLCLQEVNGQPVRGQAERELIALDQLLAGTPYADYHRVSTSGPDGHGVADVHNLVTLSALASTGDTRGAPQPRTAPAAFCADRRASRHRL